MTRRLLAVLLAGTLATVPTALHAQFNSSFSIAGGLSAPLSDLKTRTDAGYNLAGALSFGAPLVPVGVRLELGYNGYNVKNSLSNTGKVGIISGTANATLALGPTGASPYVIGGVGLYNRRFSEQGFPDNTKSVGGINGGGGIRFPLGLISTFVEARYHLMLGNKTDLTNLSYIPVTFGINF